MSLSDISELTDLSTDEEDVPLAKSTSKVKKAPKEYKVTHVLRPPRTAQYTAKSLYDQIIDNAIDLDPEYQRDVVWQEEKQSGLIDSILRNYYIPPIIFAVTVQDDGSELRTCIDGKQRLTSIQRFIDGQIPHKDSFTNEKLWYKHSATNTRRKLLPQHLRTLFANKQIVCVEYTGLDDDQEREIFQRVQLGVALTPAERLQALVGPWSAVIREIQTQVLGEEGFEGYLDWGHARGRDFQCLATIGYLIENHPKTTIPGPKVLEKWLQKPQSVSSQLRTDLHETFRIFVTLARDKKYSGSLNRPTRVSPIEFVMIGVLIYLKRKSLSLTQISSAIEKMRKDVRASHQDIRSNARVTKHLMEFMAKKIKVSELKGDGEGDKPATQVLANAAKPVKRKRPVYSDDSDSELIPKVAPAKHSTNGASAKAVKSSKYTSTANGPKMNAIKKAAVAPSPKVTTNTKASRPSTSFRTTNNSLSNLSPVPAKKSLPPVTQSRDRTPPPASSTSNDHATLRSARHPPLTVQTGPAVKAESPQTSSLNLSAASPVADRLAPIRAAKASLAAGTSSQSPVNSGSEGRAIPNAGAPVTLVDSRQNPLSQVPAYQHPLLTPSIHPLSQHPPGNPGQGRPVPPQLEVALRTLHAQFPQLGPCAPSVGNDAVRAVASGQDMQPRGRMVGHHMSPGSVNLSSANNPRHISQGYGVGISQVTQNGVTGTQTTLSQPPVPNGRPSSSSGIGNMGSRLPPMNSLAPPMARVHALPQRPPFTTSTPSNSMWAEPLGSSRSTSLENMIPSGPRGSYNRDRHHPADDRRPNRHDRNHDIQREKRNWFRSRT